jgi:hypothetical protein
MIHAMFRGIVAAMAFIVDHLLFGLVLNEMRSRPRE